MHKVELINTYVERVAETITGSNQDAAKKLQTEILGVYEPQVKDIRGSLDRLGFYEERQVDYLGNLGVLRAKLINYRCDLEREDQQRAEEMEKLSLQQRITINNQNQASANATSTTSVSVMLQQTLEGLKNLPAGSITAEQLETLDDKLTAIEAALKSNDKERVASKVGSVLRYVVDKGIQVGIAVLPYLGEISKLLQAKG